MHVVDSDLGKGPSSGQVPDITISDLPKKNVAVSVAASTTTVDDGVSVKSESREAEPKSSLSPKINGVCDSAGEGAKGKSSRRTSKEVSVSDSKEALAAASLAVEIKVEDDEPATVESSEPQDLTVTCTSSFEQAPKPFPSAKYISISVEQCQSTPPSTSGEKHQSDGHSKSKMVNRKRSSTKSCDGDETGYKRGRVDEREACVSEFVEKASGAGLDELQRTVEALQQEIHGLSALARTKEVEWNDLIRLKKMKEEMYLRLIRRRQVMMMMAMGSGSRPPDGNQWDFALENRMSEFFTSDEVSLNRVKTPKLPSNLTITKSQGSGSGASQQLQRFLLHPQRQEQQQQQQQGRSLKIPKSSRTAPFPILPKPCQQDQIPSTGRQGAIVDVKSIIADYRQSHPETIPRRGRRMKGQVADNMVTSSRGVISMSSLAFGSGSQVRTVGSTSGPEETSRPSSADSSRSDAVSFKDVLVQFAKMSTPPKPPPPYPEVTLHPVVSGNSQSPPPNSSLLHGILTKPGAPGNGGKPTAFSPTLARLLTTPDRPSTTTTITTALRGTGTSASSSNPSVSISELLSSSKKRNELTITPVISNTQPAKVKDEPVSGSSQQEDDPEDSDRLVIDEGDELDTRGDDGENEGPEPVPECQGCHLKPAQFVCAGCGNQWYCSRNCQVNAWDDHSDVCSG